MADEKLDLSTPFGLAKFHADIYGKFTAVANSQCREALQRNDSLRVHAAILKAIEYDIKIIQELLEWRAQEPELDNNDEKREFYRKVYDDSRASVGRSYKYLIEHGITV